jgi:hypothetical protein
MYLSVILIWNRISETESRQRNLLLLLRAAGLIVLISLIILYRGRGEPAIIEIRPSWWGILGLIGWAYLVASSAYLSFRLSKTAVLGMCVLLYLVYLADKAGAFSTLNAVIPWLNIGSMLGSQAAITLSGVLLGMILLPGSPVQKGATTIRWAMVYGTGLLLAGFLTHTLSDIHDGFIINKILATPPWGLISSACTVYIWIVIYYLVDWKGISRWTVIIKPAGENALFAYILAPVFYSLFKLFADITGAVNVHDWLGTTFGLGFWRALLFAFFITWLAGGLRKMGIILKL